MVAGKLSLNLAFFRGPAWAVEISTGETDSTLKLMRSLERLWRDRPEPKSPILQVGVVLSKLLDQGNFTPPLFQTVADRMAEVDDEKHRRLDTTLDKLRARYGKKVVYFGNVQECRANAPMRISFTHIPEVKLEAD